jgi:hypothetical protein
MRQFILRSALLIVIAIAALPAAGQTPDFTGELPIKSRHVRDASMRERLTKVVNVGVSSIRKCSLDDALNKLSDEYDLCFDVDERAFKEEGVEEVLDLEVTLESLPQMRSMPVSTVVETLLSRLPPRLEATYLLWGKVIEITTKNRVQEACRTSLQMRAWAFVHFLSWSDSWKDRCEVALDLLAEAADQQAALTERSKPATTWIKVRSWEKGRNP